MSNESLIPPYNPSFQGEDEVKIDIDARRQEFFLMMDSIVQTLKDEKKVDNAYNRLATKIIDSLLWKLFKFFMLLLLIGFLCAGSYCVYYFWIRDDVDSLFSQIVKSFNGIAALLSELINAIKELHNLLLSFGESAKEVVEEVQTHMLNSEDKMDAMLLAIN